MSPTRPQVKIQPQVKICGITRPEDADLAVDLGADLLGLNFYPASPRYVEPGAARRIAQAVHGRIPLVGVFVNAPPAQVEAIRRQVGLDLLQLHGEEGKEEVQALGARALKVVRLKAAATAETVEGFPEAWGFLFELRHTSYGGKGQVWNYAWLRGLELDRPCLVAGGIRPETARQALAASGAGGVDVCSGVEAAPGIKDRGLMERLFTEVRRGQDPAAER
jgi:phosphoribosylanthranilate isomerase